jgi:hypothetical protein
MKVKIISALLICTSMQLLAQEKEATIKTFGKTITDKFPTTRTFDLQYEQLGATDFESKFFGENLDKGKIDEHNRLKFAFNLPFYKSDSKRFVLTSSFRYKYESYDFGQTFSTNADVPFTSGKQDFHYFAGALSATYMAKLFKKPIIYNATVSVDANHENVQRVKGFISANLVLKKNANTTITIGALAILDPSSIIPVTPLFTYNHKFKDSKWDVDFILPQRLLFRRELLNNGRISLGTELNSENFYLNLNTPRLNGIYELNQLELKSGITYEYHITSKIIGLFKVGANNVLSTRITERGERTNKYIYDQKEDMQAYFRFGVSYNPF